MAVEIIRRRFTADEYQHMGRTGILREDDRVELIDGEVLAMSPTGPPRIGAVNRLNRLFARLVGDDAIVQVQLPVRLDPHSEPQPDLALLRPRPDFYGTAAAGPADILLAVEVAQSSLAYDRDVKAGLYARRGVAEYWIVDLNGAAIIRHTDPADGRYRHVAVVPAGQPFAPGLLPGCLVTTHDIFG